MQTYEASNKMQSLPVSSGDTGTWYQRVWRRGGGVTGI